jgi:hypothetical protein
MGLEAQELGDAKRWKSRSYGHFHTAQTIRKSIYRSQLLLIFPRFPREKSAYPISDRAAC